MEGYKNRSDANKKSFKKFRHRAHANPFSDKGFPLPCTLPHEFPLEAYYPSPDCSSNAITLVDIGCGYGDFVRNFSVVYPYKKGNIIGLELRDKPVLIAQQAILDARQKSFTEKEGQCDANTVTETEEDRAFTEGVELRNVVDYSNSENCNKNHHYCNTAVVRCNCMTSLPRILMPHTVEIMTIMFPDPQFKHTNERRRIVSHPLLTEYAYFLKENTGVLMTATDVKELHEYMTGIIATHPLFEEVKLEALEESDEQNIAAYDKNENLFYARRILSYMNHTADAKRHMRKDDDDTVYKSVWIRKPNPPRI